MPVTSDEMDLKSLLPGDLTDLASTTDSCCVSILMQTHRSGREVQQGPIRLKNLLDEATKKVKAAEQDPGMLGRLSALIKENQFWQHQGEGLAIFLNPDDCRMFRLNRTVDDRVYVGNSFFVQPLIRESNSGGEYFVLSLSWDEAKLYRADGNSFSVVKTDLLPARFDELVLPRDAEESLQNTSHRAVGNSAGTSTAMFHGHGEGEDKIEADRDQYLSLVGDEVAAAFYNTDLPLVVVATSEVTGHFEATNKVTVDAKVEGSPSEWSDKELREHAHQKISPLLKADRGEFVERFNTAMANAKASDDLNEVLTSAKEGRVESLMVCQNDDHYDQTNEAVVETLRNGGDVVQCSPESMPTRGTTVAAIFRFENPVT